MLLPGFPKSQTTGSSVGEGSYEDDNVVADNNAIKHISLLGIQVLPSTGYNEVGATLNKAVGGPKRLLCLKYRLTRADIRGRALAPRL